MRNTSFLSALMAGLALSSLAGAVTRTVPAGYPTIQAAVTAAASGDVILIAAGDYRENVTVPAGKSLNITSVLPGQPCYTNTSVIVDGTPLGVEGTAFDIDSDGTTIQCLTIRHADYGIDASGNSLTVLKVRILHTSSDAVYVSGNSFRITDSVFQSIGDSAIDADGNNGVIQNNQAQLTDSSCYEVYGDNNLIQTNTAKNCEDDDGIYFDGNFVTLKNNTVDHTDDSGIEGYGNDILIQTNRITNVSYGIYVEGDRLQILQNTLENSDGGDGVYAYGNDMIVRTNNVKSTDDECYDLEGDNLIVEGNIAVDCMYGGFDIYGWSPVVRQNTADKVGEDDAFYIDCSGGCSTSRVEGNTGNGCNDDDSGFDIYASDSGMTIASNRANFNSQDGFYIYADGATITLNQATWNGAEQEHGFDIYGDGNLITSNTASYNGDAGFYVEGLYNTLRLNTASYNFDDGFEVIGVYNIGPSGPGTITMDRNTANYNQGEGLENWDPSAIFTTNTSRFNRKGGDCTNDGTLMTNTANVCADGSNFVPVHQID